MPINCSRAMKARENWSTTKTDAIQAKDERQGHSNQKKETQMKHPKIVTTDPYRSNQIKSSLATHLGPSLAYGAPGGPRGPASRSYGPYGAPHGSTCIGRACAYLGDGERGIGIGIGTGGEGGGGSCCA